MHVTDSNSSKNTIYESVRRSIILGHLMPGEKLDPNALAEQYGTSITPVRDALRTLNQEELVVIKPRSGYYVAHMTFKDLSNLLDLREIVEIAAVERATTRITAEQLDELEKLNMDYTGDDDLSSERYFQENRRFFCLIAEASGNERLVDLVCYNHDRLARFLILIRKGETVRPGNERIIQAMRAHDVELARQIVSEELAKTRNRIMERIINDEGDSWQVGIGVVE